MYGNYDINNANVDMSSRHLYPPLGDMSNYARGCPEDSVKKDDKYWERRRKNNLAAKKSRDSRRIRENQMRLRVLCLENANQMLKEEIDRKDSEISRLKYVKCFPKNIKVTVFPHTVRLLCLICCQNYFALFSYATFSLAMKTICRCSNWHNSFWSYCCFVYGQMVQRFQTETRVCNNRN